jgi:hypothetical protein
MNYHCLLEFGEPGFCFPYNSFVFGFQFEEPAEILLSLLSLTSLELDLTHQEMGSRVKRIVLYGGF